MRGSPRIPRFRIRRQLPGISHSRRLFHRAAVWRTGWSVLCRAATRSPRSRESPSPRDERRRAVMASAHEGTKELRVLVGIRLGIMIAIVLTAFTDAGA